MTLKTRSEPQLDEAAPAASRNMSTEKEYPRGKRRIKYKSNFTQAHYPGDLFTEGEPTEFDMSNPIDFAKSFENMVREKAVEKVRETLENMNPAPPEAEETE